MSSTPFCVVLSEVLSGKFLRLDLLDGCTEPAANFALVSSFPFPFAAILCVSFVIYLELTIQIYLLFLDQILLQINKNQPIQIEKKHTLIFFCRRKYFRKNKLALFFDVLGTGNKFRLISYRSDSLQSDHLYHEYKASNL